MELRQLRYFVTVAETLNFSRAAEALYISQSALSQQVADLEREVGVVLLLRDKRSVELTKAGQTMLKESKKLLHRAEKLVPLVRQQGDSSDDEQELFIGIEFSVNSGMNSPFRILLTQTIHDLRKKAPGLRPVYFGYEHLDMRRALDNGIIDLGFFMRFECSAGKTHNEFNSEVQRRVLSDDELVLAYRSDCVYEDTIENVHKVLKERGLILLNKETMGMSGVLQILSEIGAKPNIRFSDDRMTMIFATESGEGATVLPVSIVRGLRDPKLGILHFRVPQAKCQLVAAWKKSCANPLVESLIETISEGILRDQ